MLTTFAQVTQACEGREIRDGKVEDFERQRTELRARAALETLRPGGAKLGEPERVRRLVDLVRQVLLHRAVFLYEGALDLLVAGNPYAMILAIRGFFETAGATGYVHRRLSSAVEGSIELARADKDIGDVMKGTGQNWMREGETRMVDAVQVMTMLDKADESTRKHLLEAWPAAPSLRKSYEHLCEWAHPNFNSHAVAIQLDHDRRGAKHSFEPVMGEEEFATLGHLQLGASLYVLLHDDIDRLLDRLPKQRSPEGRAAETGTAASGFAVDQRRANAMLSEPSPTENGVMDIRAISQRLTDLGALGACPVCKGKQRTVTPQLVAFMTASSTGQGASMGQQIPGFVAVVCGKCGYTTLHLHSSIK